jgi:hypothetical protein
MDLSDNDLEQIAGADRREVDPPIQVETATWSKSGQLDWWVREWRDGGVAYAINAWRTRHSDFPTPIKRLKKRGRVGRARHPRLGEANWALPAHQADRLRLLTACNAIACWRTRVPVPSRRGKYGIPQDSNCPPLRLGQWLPRTAQVRVAAAVV